MNIQSLKHQLLRDLKASWQKTAILGVLLAIGMVIWSVQLVRAFTGESATESEAIVPTAETAPSPPTPPVRTAELVPASPAPGGLTWEQANEMLRTDPLVRSAEVAAIQSHPFRVDHDQFPPPVLFAEESAPPQRPHVPTDDASAPSELVLKSTIVGVSRRAAFINSRLYFEGSEIQAGGRTYRLTAVHPKKVVVSDGKQTLELTIASPSPSDQFEVESPPRSASGSPLR